MSSHGTERREVEIESITKLYEYFICSTCGKVFREAVKVREPSSRRGETYYACPRCLTEINIHDSPPKNPEPAAPVPPKPLYECTYYENLKKRLIPDECLVCPKLIECSKKG